MTERPDLEQRARLLEIIRETARTCCGAGATGNHRAYRAALAGAVDQIMQALASSSVPEQDYADLIDRIMVAVCDPGCIVGYKGERSLNEWQRDALQVILPPPPAPQDRGASQEDGR